MGGIMPYSRVRHRNMLSWRNEPGGDYYPRDSATAPAVLNPALCGDLNRMEADALGESGYGDAYPQEIAGRAGVDVETVKRVLRAFFHDEYGGR